MHEYGCAVGIAEGRRAQGQQKRAWFLRTACTGAPNSTAGCLRVRCEGEATVIRIRAAAMCGRRVAASIVNQPAAGSASSGFIRLGQGELGAAVGIWRTIPSVRRGDCPRRDSLVNTLDRHGLVCGPSGCSSRCVRPAGPATVAPASSSSCLPSSRPFSTPTGSSNSADAAPRWLPVTQVASTSPLLRLPSYADSSLEGSSLHESPGRATGSFSQSDMAVHTKESLVLEYPARDDSLSNRAPRGQRHN